MPVMLVGIEWQGFHWKKLRQLQLGGTIVGRPSDKRLYNQPRCSWAICL